ncbi:Outer membrane receptor for ferrienterochelin and colicins [Alteromonadaceae bacterium Bs31]|nr:Outer membrane receptor for ferrienterochelin and colicins [Alteromonadaceae bacterium Bs31]
MLLASSSLCFGQVNDSVDESIADPINDIFSLPLSQLINIRVTSANKQSEPIFKAPAIITSWSETDIHLLGHNNLAELANITPGWFSYRNIGENTFVTRGQKASGFDNNRHLVMLDDIPINHTRANTAPADTQVPVFFANNIEFLRGPASALYGASAFYGVINMKSAEADTEPKSYLQLQRSNLQQDTLLNTYYLTRGKSAHAGIRLGLQSQNASMEEVNNNQSHRDYNDQQSKFAYATFGLHSGSLTGLDFGAYHSEKKGGLGNFWADYSRQENEITWRTSLAYLKYQKQIKEALSLKTYIKYNASNESAEYLDKSGEARSSYDYPFHNTEAQAELAWQPANNHNFISGINYDTRYGEASEVIVNNSPRTTPRTPTLETRSVWLQYQGEYKHNTLTLGLRRDEGLSGTDRYQQNSPRLALVQKINDNFNIKLLYGEALRGPSVKELGVNNEVSIENPDTTLNPLEQETLITYEISPFIQTRSSLASFTLFKTETENFIARDWGNLGEYINLGGRIESKGYELEFNHLLSRSNKLFVNYSHAESRNESGIIIEDLPQSQFNIGLLWQNQETLPVSGSLTWRWVEGFTAEPGKQAGDGFNSLDMHLLYHFDNNMSLGLKLNNLGDNQIYMPQNSQRGVKMREREAVLKFIYTL